MAVLGIEFIKSLGTAKKKRRLIFIEVGFA